MTNSPEPPGGWKDVADVGDVMSDDEIRALGFEPTARGWRRIEVSSQDETETNAPPGFDWREQLRRRFA